MRNEMRTRKERVAVRGCGSDAWAADRQEGLVKRDLTKRKGAWAV